MAKGVPNQQYTPEFKEEVIRTMQEEKLGYLETAEKLLTQFRTTPTSFSIQTKDGSTNTSTTKTCLSKRASDRV